MPLPRKATRSIAGAVVERRIHTVKGHRVMLDTDLAELYHVETFNLNKAVKRNASRFLAISCSNSRRPSGTL